jgi:CRP/FNR family cyclic AMP-dependent transcriptional regulator
MPSELSRPTLPIFSWIGHLKDDDRELLSSYGEFFPGHPGSVVIEEGKLQDGVFVVISGRLEVRATQEDGTIAILAELGPGETLGEVSLFDPGPATATVIASEFTQLWRIADADLIQFMTDNPGAGNILLRTLATILSQRLRQVDPKAYGLSSYAVVDSPGLPPATGPLPVPTRPVMPPAADEEAPFPSGASKASRPGLSEMPARRKIMTGTQAMPDPDQLEPL